MRELKHRLTRLKTEIAILEQCCHYCRPLDQVNANLLQSVFHATRSMSNRPSRGSIHGSVNAPPETETRAAKCECAIDEVIVIGERFLDRFEQSTRVWDSA